MTRQSRNKLIVTKELAVGVRVLCSTHWGTITRRVMIEVTTARPLALGDTKSSDRDEFIFSLLDSRKPS